MGQKIVIDGLNWVIKLYDAGGYFGHYKIIDKRHDQGVPRENVGQNRWWPI